MIADRQTHTHRQTDRHAHHNIRSPIGCGEINEALLQLTDSVHTTFINSLLHNAPYLVIQWI